jgi:probable F420-dependent oxidoreductase
VRVGVALGNVGLGLRDSEGRPIGAVEHARRCLEVAAAAEELGFDAVWAGDHLALPRQPSVGYPYAGGAPMDAETSVLDPFAVLAAVAARTERIELGFGVLVLPLRHPLVAAKGIATLDALSAGRVVLGVGAGWLPEELAAVDASFEARGARTDAALVELRGLLADGATEDGSLTVLPRSVRQPVPMLVGGGSPRALRRAVTLADGWDAPWKDPERLGGPLATLARSCDARGRDPAGLRVAVRAIPADRLDAAAIERYASIGAGGIRVTDLGVHLPPVPTSEAVDKLADLAARVTP